MSTLLVVESMWGNTRQVAQAVAAQLGDDARVVDVADAPTTLPPDVDLLVVGGPTHAFSMSRARTRHDAAAQGAPVAGLDVGIREWLDRLPDHDPVDVATFDSRVGSMRHTPGSAAKAAARQVRRRHLGRVLDTQSFYVAGSAGPLLDGELERAGAWGRSLLAQRDRPGRRRR
ncbi:flavodoxin family protein [Jannaschia sp. R86511]|uniref:flavodoxin family protein n=1 Tax=Jannaschia sp. R86511 TaxID=3093853 RepID=UPI0036D2A47F